MLNVGALHASGEIILFLADGAEIFSANWMSELLMYTQRSDVGASYGQLLKHDNTVFSGALIIGFDSFIGSANKNEDISNLGYMGRACYAQNTSIFNGKCMMIRKDLFFELGKFDNIYTFNYYDVSFSSKLIKNFMIFTTLKELNIWKMICKILNKN